MSESRSLPSRPVYISHRYEVFDRPPSIFICNSEQKLFLLLSKIAYRSSSSLISLSLSHSLSQCLKQPINHHHFSPSLSHTHVHTHARTHAHTQTHSLSLSVPNSPSITIIYLSLSLSLSSRPKQPIDHHHHLPPLSFSHSIFSLSSAICGMCTSSE